MSSPLGQRESLRVEFKSAAALAEPRTIARAVVAFLNSSGGTVWVGVKERDGEAIALEPIAEGSRARVAVQDAIVDLVEPTPNGEQVEVAIDGATQLLKVSVKQGRLGPYALRTGNQREFLARFGDRTRVLSHAELGELFSDSMKEHGQLPKRVRQAEARVAELHRLSPPGLSLVVVGVPAGGADLGAPGLKELVRTVVRDPQTAGNRRLGWTFHSPSPDLKRDPRRLLCTDPSGDEVKVMANGDLAFHAPLDRLRWAGSKGPDSHRDIHPLALLELSTSAIRILREFVRRGLFRVSPADFVFRLGLLSVRDWTLVPGSPLRWTGPAENAPFPDSDAVSPDLLRSAGDLEANPDHISMLLLRQIYLCFGLAHDQMPPEFDQQRGLLVLSD